MSPALNFMIDFFFFLNQANSPLQVTGVDSPFNRFQVHSPGKAKRLSSCKRKGFPSVEVGLKLHRKTSNVGRARDPGMANKENELTCSDDVRGIHYNDNCGLPVNSAEASKMAGASSKYSDFTEVRDLAEL